MDSAKIALKVFEMKKKALFFKQKIQLNKVDLAHLDMVHTLKTKQILKKIEDVKKSKELDAEHERDALIAKYEAEAAADKERAL